MKANKTKPNTKQVKGRVSKLGFLGPASPYPSSKKLRASKTTKENPHRQPRLGEAGPSGSISPEPSKQNTTKKNKWKGRGKIGVSNTNTAVEHDTTEQAKHPTKKLTSDCVEPYTNFNDSQGNLRFIVGWKHVPPFCYTNNSKAMTTLEIAQIASSLMINTPAFANVKSTTFI